MCFMTDCESCAEGSQRYGVQNDETRLVDAGKNHHTQIDPKGFAGKVRIVDGAAEPAIALGGLDGFHTEQIPNRKNNGLTEHIEKDAQRDVEKCSLE